MIRIAARVFATVCSAGMFVAACSVDEQPVYVDDVVTVETPAANPLAVPQTETPASPITVDRAWSPEPATAEILGRGALVSDSVTVDGQPGVIDEFTIDDAGSFVIRVRIDVEGSYSVCVRDACNSVFVLAET